MAAAAAASLESSDSIEVEGKARLAEPDYPMA
jgi:hypothetical protein